MARIGWYVLAPLLVGYGVLQFLGRRAGSTAEERRMRMPGDELVARPHMTNHAISIEARPADVWPWLTQMGWHLGGWYTPEWVDRLLFPKNWPSLDHLDPALLRRLDVGDTIPDGPPGTAEYVVVVVDAPHALVLRSTTHLPSTWREKFGAEIDWTWSFRLTELPGGRTRLQQRVRGRTAPRWLTATYLATIIPADYRWTTPIDGWFDHGGRWLPTGGHAIWHLDGGEFEYVRGRFVPEGVAFNIPPGVAHI